jgi:hypothetical protein
MEFIFKGLISRPSVHPVCGEINSELVVITVFLFLGSSVTLMSEAMLLYSVARPESRLIRWLSLTLEALVRSILSSFLSSKKVNVR